MKRRISITVGALLLLVVVATYFRPVSEPERVPVPETAAPVQAQRGSATGARSAGGGPGANPASLSADELRSTNLIAQLMKEGEEAPQLTSEQLRNLPGCQSAQRGELLGAFRISGDRNFLKEAREKFPNDPRVAFASLFKTDSSDERREWLDRFKQLAPDNSMPGYLAALDQLKAGQSDRAVEELAAAAGKSGFQDYSLDFMQSAEEAYRSAGYSDAEAKAIAASQLLLPHLAELRDLGRKLTDLSSSYRPAGDQESAQAALPMAVDLGRRLENPSGWNTLIRS
jgi:hypothetical protein